MENLAHTLTGLAIARSAPGSRVPFAALTLVAAANAPDLDIAVAVNGPLYYLHYHRGITHGLLGTVVLGILIGLAAWCLRSKSRQPFASLPSCVGMALLAALTHPLLDYTNSYGLRPFLPFSELRFFGDLEFIIDPLLWVILGLGVYLASSPGRLEKGLWVVGVFVAFTFGIFAATLFSHAIWYLPTLLTAVVAGLVLRSRLGPHPSAAVLALGAMVVYWLLLLASSQMTVQHARTSATIGLPDFSGATISAIPRPVDPLSWDIFMERENEFAVGAASVLDTAPVTFEVIERNRSSPEVRAALDTCPGRILAHFGRFDFWEVERAEEGPVVIFRDARFTRYREEGFGTFRIGLSRDLRRDRVAVPCPAPGQASGACR